MAARLGAQAAQGGSQREQIQGVVESLSKLKGAAMKLGQTVSVEMRDLLPPEVIEVLSSLQDQGSALSGAQIREILQKEWSPYPELEAFSEAPLASASIGQVHAARYRGQEIVLKVQFPGIARSIESDIAGMGVILKSLLTLSGRKMALEPFLEELAQIFKQETDYLQEASFLKEYAQHFSQWPGYRIPQVIDELTTPRVLAMTRERGLKPLDWVKLRQPSQSLRDRVAARFLDLYELEFFRMGLVQTDPNFANFLIDDSVDRQNPTLTLLDLGASKRFEPVFVSEYRRLLQLTREGSHPELLEQCMKLSLLDPRESAETQALLVELLQTAIRPFRPELQPFDFRDADYARDTREAALRLSQSCRFSPPPRNILFLHRKLGGLFNLAKALEAQIDLTAYWERLVSQPTHGV